MSKLDEFINTYDNPFVKLKSINRTFFLDESNNIKKGRIGVEKDNVNDLAHLCFVLGGIVTKNEINLNDLLNFIGARQVLLMPSFLFLLLSM